MLREQIDELIARETKCNSGCLGILKLIKAEFQKYNASKESVTKKMDDAIEVQILNKMVKQRKEAEELYVKGGRQDLAYNERKEYEFIELYLPTPITEEQIEEAFAEVLSCGAIPPQKKNMGLYIRYIKNKYPTADGKIVSQIVSKKLS